MRVKETFGEAYVLSTPVQPVPLMARIPVPAAPKKKEAPAPAKEEKQMGNWERTFKEGIKAGRVGGRGSFEEKSNQSRVE